MTSYHIKPRLEASRRMSPNAPDLDMVRRPLKLISRATRVSLRSYGPGAIQCIHTRGRHYLVCMHFTEKIMSNCSHERIIPPSPDLPKAYHASFRMKITNPCPQQNSVISHEISSKNESYAPTFSQACYVTLSVFYALLPQIQHRFHHMF